MSATSVVTGRRHFSRSDLVAEFGRLAFRGATVIYDGEVRFELVRRRGSKRVGVLAVGVLTGKEVRLGRVPKDISSVLMNTG